MRAPHAYSSLREIYEARIKFQHQLHQLQQHQKMKNMNLNKNCDEYCNEKSKKNLQLKQQHERRQRNVDNQPDVVPKPSPPMPTPSLSLVLEHHDYRQQQQPYGMDFYLQYLLTVVGWESVFDLNE